MPHLQVTQSTNNGGVKAKDAATKHEASDSPGSSSDKGAKSLLKLAATASEQVGASKESSAAVSKKRRFDENTAARHGHEPAFAPVTPSPFGRGLSFRVHPPHSMYHQPPVMYTRGHGGVLGSPSPGARRLFPSPIRVDTRTQLGDKTSKKDNDNAATPDRLRTGSIQEQASSPPGSGTPNEKKLMNGRVQQEPGQRPHEHPFPLPSPPHHSPYYMAHHAMPPFPGYPGAMQPHRLQSGHSPVDNSRSPPRKRLQMGEGFSPMKTRIQVEKESDRSNLVPSDRPVPSSSCKPVDKEQADREKKVTGPEATKQQAKKQRVISPSSSLENSQASVKGDEDESVERRPREVSPHGTLLPPSGSAPHVAPGQMSAGRYPPFYPPGPSCPHPQHFHGGVPMHGWQNPHHYPMHPMHPPGMIQNPAGYMYPPQGHYPGVPPHPNAPHYHPYPYPRPKEPHHSPPTTPEKESVRSAAFSGSSTRKNDKATKGAIKSVAEWQQATIATGMAPSANRCVPLKGPIPSKYWGEAEKAKAAKIPEFHHLVNFPDYMGKNLPPQNGAGGSQDGKRHCVMCGKERLSSANAMSRSRSSAKSRSNNGAGFLDSDDGDDSSSSSTIHIIPRQNKGLCTACDVRVWIVCDSGVEIKWCKGCKNFRPWAAFGDKGLATKCVRCRDRQREKYASQRDELKNARRRTAAGIGEEKSSKELEYAEEKKLDDGDESHHEIAAARGLHNLIAASVEMNEKKE